MTATILDTVTQEKRVVRGPRSWEWAENGWSCDCNRVPVRDERRWCSGSHRYLVIAAAFDDPEDYDYSLRELNSEYPEDLIRLWL